MKIAVVLILVLAGLAACFCYPKNHTKTRVAGTQTINDALHPTEIYYGASQFKDLKSMAADLAVTVYPQDRVKTFPPPELGLGSQITIRRATPVEVTDAKKTETLRTWSTTVGAMMTEQNIGLLGKDSVSPDVTTPIYSNMPVKITRVADVEVTLTEPIDFKTTKQYSIDLPQGQNQVKVAGVQGQKITTYMVHRVDGEEVSRRVESTQTTKQPVAEELVVGYGPRLASGVFSDIINAAAKKYTTINFTLNGTALSCMMMRESNGHTDSVAAAGYEGLFQYDPGFWASASADAGYGGAAWTDPKAQIFTTAFEIAHGSGRRWPTWAGCAGK